MVLYLINKLASQKELSGLRTGTFRESTNSGRKLHCSV